MDLSAKFRFKAGKPLYILEMPAGSDELFPGHNVVTSLAGKKSLSQVLLYARDRKTLDSRFPKVIERLEEDGVFWIAYPKKSSGILSDLLETKNWQVIFDSGYLIVSSAAIDDSWSGVRIKKKDPLAKYKSSVPMEQRKVKGIDYVNRTVTLPDDAVHAMKPFKGLDTFFYSMSFSHKREYIEAIEEAKQPETRQRRIERMIEMVQKKRIEKENKKK